MKKPLLVLLAVIAALLVSQQDKLWPLADWQPARQAPAARDQQLSSYIDQLESRSFNDNGELVSRIQTTSARQYRGSDLVEMQQPLFSAGNGLDSWAGQARRGLLDYPSQQLTLIDDVVFYQQANAAKIHTRRLVIDARQQQAHSDAGIDIVADRSTTTAKGMQIDFNTHTIELAGDVRTHYRPPRPADTGNAGDDKPRSN
ncbi:MAG TPA: LPS export ABC transporter periplasmic protein LptC [Pseudomonadales bacterium]